MLVSDTCDISLALSCLQRGRLDKLIRIWKVNNVTKKVIKNCRLTCRYDDDLVVWNFAWNLLYFTFYNKKTRICFYDFLLLKNVVFFAFLPNTLFMLLSESLIFDKLHYFFDRPKSNRMTFNPSLYCIEMETKKEYVVIKFGLKTLTHSQKNCII